jgi:Lrp/AsnC family transcriptional regulator, regulator for asnA, asnC and gidA
MRKMRLDALDKRIIVALEADGRRPYRDIARDLDVAEATVRARVGRLIDSGLIHITAVGDPLRLGVSTAAITLVRTRPGTVHDVARRLAAAPNVRFVGTSFGSADIVIQTLHRDMKALHEFITVEIPRLAPDVTGTETLQLADVLKSSWDWRAWFEEAEGTDAGARPRQARAGSDAPSTSTGNTPARGGAAPREE